MNKCKTGCPKTKKLTKASLFDELVDALRPFAEIAKLRPKPDGTDREWYEFEIKLKNCLPHLANVSALLERCKTI